MSNNHKKKTGPKGFKNILNRTILIEENILIIIYPIGITLHPSKVKKNDAKKGRIFTKHIN